MEKKFGGWEFSVKETDDGITVQFKGDKSQMQARREAVAAFRQFRQKAKAAGMFPGSLFRAAVLGLLTSEDEDKEEN